jgi:hypothetical protein
LNATLLPPPSNGCNPQLSFCEKCGAVVFVAISSGRHFYQ